MAICRSVANTTPAIVASIAAIAVIGGLAIYLSATVPDGPASPIAPTTEPPTPVPPVPDQRPEPPTPDPEPAAVPPPTTTIQRTSFNMGTVTLNEEGAGLSAFESFEDYADYLSEYEAPLWRGGPIPEPRLFADIAVPSMMETDGLPDSSAADPSSSSTTHSTTNVQVVGVDEADFVKNDGRHIYVLKHNKLAIVDTQASNPDQPASMTTLDIPPLVQKYDMFVNDNTLVVLYYLSTYNQAGQVEDYTTYALMLDISSKLSPNPQDEFSVPGMLQTARMIGDHVYVVASKIPDYEDPAMPILTVNGEPVQETPIFYPSDEDDPYAGAPPRLVSVMALDLQAEQANSVAFLMDPRGATLMSHTNLYLTSAGHGTDAWAAFDIVSQLLRYIIDSLNEPHRTNLAAELDAVGAGDEDAISELLASTLSAYIESPPGTRADIDIVATQELSKIVTDLGLTTEATEIYRIGVEGTNFEIAARGSVPGHMLNQFSMDEQDGKLRVATTVSGRLSTFNNVFVLDSGLGALGALTGIAPDEDIYSARFVGDRLYLVTFRQIDPFFVIDLSTDDPKILGELKMPGYSDYLHFYDESTVIGIGRERGLKLAMFDITDITKPLLADSIVLGSWGTWSPAERDHKALLVSNEHEFMSLPVISDNDDVLPLFHPAPVPGTAKWGNFVFLVYSIDPGGFELEESITHTFNIDTDALFARSLYIGETYYTVSEHELTGSPLGGHGIVKRVPLDLS